MEKPRELAVTILDVFEDMLEQKGITIPDEDDQRTPDNNARLHGMTYAILEDAITEILEPEMPREVPFVILREYDEELEKRLNGGK